MIRTATGIGVGLVALFIVTSHADRLSGTSGQAPQTRLSWQEFSKDPAKVKSLVAAFAAMRANDTAAPTSADYRRSLQYWGAIHSYYGTTSPRGPIATAVSRLNATLPQFVGFFKGLTDLTPPDPLAVEVWNKCQHSGFRQDGTFVQAENFFGWHRIYLYYFEQVLRTLSKDNTLRLPYWDYTDPAQVAFPAEFANGANGPVNAPLFDFRRTQGLNDGLVVVNDQLSDVDDALTNGEFLGEDGFSWAIEGGVHGNIHCAVGNTCPVPLMGSVALSANDPIFWLHHANIDRLWDCWIDRHGPPSGPWETQQYVFPDGDGNRQQRTVADFVKPSTEYVYDNVTKCSRVPPINLTAAPPQGSKSPGVVIASAANVKMDKPSATVKLTMPSTGDMVKGFSAAVGEQPSGNIELVLTKITVEKSPASLLHVYVAGPSGERQLAGTINFFGQVGEEHEHGGLTRRFDVTRQLRQMSKGSVPSDITVSFEAASGVRAAPGKANVPATMTAPTWNGTVSIGSVELQLRPRKPA